jgi:beta-phosphoglucomutase-like phosphatase (HAD superfamily)
VIRAIVFDLKGVIVATIVFTIAAGGRRAQIEETLADSGTEEAFEVIVAPGDCPTGEPDPAITSWP